MPIYDYHCDTCGETFEVIQRVGEEPLEKRFGCRKDCKLRKLLSAGSFRLKGTGWYETDFKGSKTTDE